MSGQSTSAKAGDTVRIHYTGTLLNGEQFDSSEGRDSLEFVVGSGQIIAGLDRELAGMTVGESKKVTIACVDAYGPINPEMRQTIPREGIPDDVPLDPGTVLQMQAPDGNVLNVTVIEANDATVTLDANHALAGQDLVFEFELVDLNPA